MGQVVTETREKPQKKYWIVAVVGFSILVLAAFLITRTSWCIADHNWVDDLFSNLMPPPSAWERVVGFIDGPISCLKPNEFGDFLAGVFAPIAFSLLALSVYIQSRELNETQQVMQKQLEVAEKQVEETKKSTELFAKQTAILEEDRNLRRLQNNDSLYEASAEAFRTILLASKGRLFSQKMRHEEHWRPLFMLNDMPRDAELQNAVNEICKELKKIEKNINGTQTSIEYSQNPNALLVICEGIRNLEKFLLETSHAMQMRVSVYGLDVFLEKLEALMEKLPEAPHPS